MAADPMSDADWWLCDACLSLNNLSARRCYSCRRRKSRYALRASQTLQFVSYITWDGKVHFEPAPLDAAELEALARKAHRPPRIRDPVPRSVLEVAPPYPWGTRITYWLGDPNDPARREAELPPPRLRLRLAVPIDPEMQPQIPWAEPGWKPVVGPPASSWPHWRQLLDVPTPDPARLRPGLGGSGTGSAALGRAARSMLRRAMDAASSGAFDANKPRAPWPAEDLDRKRGRKQSG